MTIKRIYFWIIRSKTIEELEQQVRELEKEDSKHKEVEARLVVRFTQIVSIVLLTRQPSAFLKPTQSLLLRAKYRNIDR